MIKTLVNLIVFILGMGMINLVILTIVCNYVSKEEDGSDCKDEEFMILYESFKLLPSLIRNGNIHQFIKLLFISAINIPISVLISIYESITSKEE